MLHCHIHGTGRALLLVPVRGMNQYRQLHFLGQLELQAVKTILRFGLVVVSNFPDGDHPFLTRI